MGRMVKLVGVPALTLVLGLLAGAAYGQRQGLTTGMAFLQSEVSGSLARHVEAAACIRVGDPDCALQVLDSMIDNAVVTLDDAEVGGPARRPMNDAKAYRGVIPSSGPRAAEVQAALEALPDAGTSPTAAQQPPSSGLGRLVARSEG